MKKYVEINYKYCKKWDSSTIYENWYIGVSVDSFLDWFNNSGCCLCDVLVSYEVKEVF